MEFGVHLPLISFAGEQRSLDDLLAVTKAANDLGYTHLCANDHLVFSRPRLDGPTALAAVLAHSGRMTLATTVAVPVLRGPAATARSGSPDDGAMASARPRASRRRGTRRSTQRKNGFESRSQQDMRGDVKVRIRKMSTSFERFKRWFRRTAGSAEDAVEEGSPVATSPPGANPVGGDVEQETSTNAQMEGAADEPWPGNT